MAKPYSHMGLGSIADTGLKHSLNFSLTQTAIKNLNSFKGLILPMRKFVGFFVRLFLFSDFFYLFLFSDAL